MSNSEISNVFGTVEEIINHLAAIINIKTLHIGKVIIFKDKFKHICDSLKDVVSVGDVLILRLRADAINSVITQWFVVEASKSEAPEVVPAVGSDLIDERVSETNNLSDDDGSQNDTRLREVGGFSEVSDEIFETSTEPPRRSCEISSEPQDRGCEVVNEVAGGRCEALPRVRKTAKPFPFKKSWISDNRCYLVNWFGTIELAENAVSNRSFSVSHSFGESCVAIDSPISYALNDNKPLGYEKLQQFVGREVLFEAQSTNGLDFVISRLWFVNSYPPQKRFLSKELRTSGKMYFFKNKLYHGKIKSVPFHDFAIANVNGVPVLIPFNVIVTQERVNRSCSSINIYLTEGDTVYLKVQKFYMTKRGDKCFRADKCWKVIKTKMDRNYEHDEQTVSWRSFWSDEGNFKEGILDQGLDTCFVNDLEINYESFFVDGTLAEPYEIERLVGSKISYIAHLKSDVKTLNCAWIGPAPSPLALLKSRLAVPEGLIDQSKVYEGVVDDFPLPTHAVCKIGIVPVLLALNSFDGNAVLENELKCGDVVMMLVKEENFEGATFLVAEYACKKTLLSHKDNDVDSYSGGFVVNLSGRILSLPNPVGMIESDVGGVVPFELCCVQAEKNKFVNNDDVFSWFKYVCEKIRVKTRVWFTAKKGSCPDIPFYAVEVCFDSEQ